MTKELKLDSRGKAITVVVKEPNKCVLCNAPTLNKLCRLCEKAQKNREKLWNK